MPLDPNRCCLATNYRDGDGAPWETRPFERIIETRSLTSGDTLDLWLASGKGAAIRFVPQR